MHDFNPQVWDPQVDSLTPLSIHWRPRLSDIIVLLPAAKLFLSGISPHGDCLSLSPKYTGNGEPAATPVWYYHRLQAQCWPWKGKSFGRISIKGGGGQSLVRTDLLQFENIRSGIHQHIHLLSDRQLKSTFTKEKGLTLVNIQRNHSSLDFLLALAEELQHSLR